MVWLIENVVEPLVQTTPPLAVQLPVTQFSAALQSGSAQSARLSPSLSEPSLQASPVHEMAPTHSLSAQST